MKPWEYDLLEKGLILPVMEEFCSLQGEGYHAGKAAYFIRIGGCDVGCAWCDVKESWNADLFPPSDVRKIIQRALSSKVRSALITGGEPLSYNLNYLCSLLKKEHFTLFLETSGSSPISGEWDWISLSPKKNNPPLINIFNQVNELKVIVRIKEDIMWAEQNAEKVSADCMLYLQPEWRKRDEITPVIVDYILNNPKWRVSVQTHKYLKIP